MPPGFWEIHDGDPVTGAVLQRLTERLDAGVVLHEGYFKTHAASYVRSRDELFFGTTDWPARVCKEILAGDDSRITADPIPEEGAIRREPGNRQMMQFLVRQARSWLSDQYRFTFRQQQWGVGIIAAPVHEVAGLRGEAIASSVSWLPESSGRFLADPFGVMLADGSGLLILAEDYKWNTAIGRISSITVSAGTFGAPHILSDLPCHLSYPYLFRHQERLYCIPETHELGEVRLYVLDQANHQWNLVKTLIDGRRLLDSTVFQYEGRWWLFATDASNGPNSKLHAWLADDLHGPWLEHRLNPLKTDIRSSRPAGRPFVHDHKLYRPGQDCSRVYGGGVAINRIVHLSPNCFEEETVRTLLPETHWDYSAGLHTLCGEGHLTIIDACRESFVASAFKQALQRKGSAMLRRLR
jgi:hypothetical protein